MVDLKLCTEAAGDFSKDYYISVRIGEVQKLSHISAARTYKFPQAAIGDRKYGKIDILRRVGTCTVSINPDTEPAQAISVNLPDDCPTRILDFRLDVSAGEGAVKRPAAVAGVEDDKASLKPYRPQMAAAKAYIEKHNIEVRLSEAMQAVIREQPEDPGEFLARKLTKAPFRIVKVDPDTPEPKPKEEESPPVTVKPDLREEAKSTLLRALSDGTLEAGLKQLAPVPRELDSDHHGSTAAAAFDEEESVAVRDHLRRSLLEAASDGSLQAALAEVRPQSAALVHRETSGNPVTPGGPAPGGGGFQPEALAEPAAEDTLIGTSIISGLDFEKLDADAELKDQLTNSMKTRFAIANGVPESQVQVVLSRGSVKVQAQITAPPGQTLSPTVPSAADLTCDIKALPGIENVTEPSAMLAAGEPDTFMVPRGETAPAPVAPLAAAGAGAGTAAADPEALRLEAQEVLLAAEADGHLNQCLQDRASSTDQVEDNSIDDVRKMAMEVLLSAAEDGRLNECLEARASQKLDEEAQDQAGDVRERVRGMLVASMHDGRLEQVLGDVASGGATGTGAQVAEGEETPQQAAVPPPPPADPKPAAETVAEDEDSLRLKAMQTLSAASDNGRLEAALSKAKALAAVDEVQEETDDELREVARATLFSGAESGNLEAALLNLRANRESREPLKAVAPSSDKEQSEAELRGSARAALEAGVNSGELEALIEGLTAKAAPQDAGQEEDPGNFCERVRGMQVASMDDGRPEQVIGDVASGGSTGTGAQAKELSPETVKGLQEAVTASMQEAFRSFEDRLQSSLKAVVGEERDERRREIEALRQRVETVTSAAAAAAAPAREA